MEAQQWYVPVGARGRMPHVQLLHVLALQARMVLEPLPQLRLLRGVASHRGAHAVQELFEQQNWVVERIVDDYTQRPRIMIARLKYG